MKNQSLIEKNIGERLRGSLLWMFFGILIWNNWIYNLSWNSISTSICSISSGIFFSAVNFRIIYYHTFANNFIYCTCFYIENIIYFLFSCFRFHIFSDRLKIYSKFNSNGFYINGYDLSCYGNIWIFN